MIKGDRSTPEMFKELMLRGIDGVKLLELIGVQFIADENRIFGTPNDDYIQRELEWYQSQSLNVNDIPGNTPQIWKQVASPDGIINSNYKIQYD